MTEERAPVGGWPRELSLDASAGPAPYITRAKSDAMISSALDEVGFAPAPPSAESKPEARATRAKGARYLAAAVLLLAFVGVGSASAAVLWYMRTQRTISLPVQPSEKPVPQAEAPRRARTTLPPPTLAQPAPERVLPAPRRRHAPEDLLVEGNRLRASRRWAKADEAYTRAFESAPASPAAYVARVASAAMRLEHLHDPRTALARYRAALRQIPNGSLGEEIRLGIADAHRALGERDEERAALREFLRAHPSSPLAKQAQARLE